ncbi:hypothetical protein MUN89_02795 [Halobacillus salinarum]|uniref:RNA polymerase sigma-70 factor, ECF subfamily n=1 Tax=Halobacillus salinarum TaxID=2932257 RepID=A0ABY4EMR1_9BACI|nr:hypothetical protein [Halobacillus salinarum]UOQ44897.1 hypothetical protein MUN89_02795 [Halobacillus salinarum]
MKELNQRVILSARKGNRKSFKKIIDFYKQNVYEICRTAIQDEDMAEEVAKEVFLYVYDNINHYHTNDKFSLWLYLVTGKHVITYREESKPHKLMGSDIQEKTQLTPHDRLLLLLNYRFCVPVAELSQIFDIPKSTLKSQVKELLENVSRSKMMF